MKLAKPVLASLNGESALILDIGLAGALLEHHGTAKIDERMSLAFRWQGEEISFECEVVRTQVMRPGTDGGSERVSHSGVQFVDPAGASLEMLQNMMATFVGRVLAAQRANASANANEGASILFQLGQARRSRSRGYVAYLWDGTSWTRRYTQLSDQPRNGFTVAAYEDEEELQTLCRAYEATDDEGRRLIRLVAELSASSMKK